MARPRTQIGVWGKINIVELDENRNIIARDNLKAKPDEGRIFRARTYYRNELGQRKQIERISSTPAKAENELIKAIRKLVASTSKDLTPDSSVAELAEAYLQSVFENVAPRSFDSYTSRINNHILHPRSGIGSLTLREATTDRLQKFVNNFVNGDEGRDIAAVVRKMLGFMFGYAARVGAIPTNPARELRSPKKVTTKATEAYSASEIVTILETLKSDEIAHQYDMPDMIAFLAGTGARIGEVLAILWDNVDLEAGTITIDANIVRVKGRGLVRQDHTKTGDVRVLPLPAPLLAVLMKRRVSDRPNLYGAVFPSSTGTFLDPRSFHKRWNDTCKRLNLPYKSSHAFRKAVATTIDLGGLTPRAAAEQLGHKDPNMTMAVYMSRRTGDKRASEEIAKHFPNQSTE